MSCYVVHTDHNLVILLPQSLEYWDYKHPPSDPDLVSFFKDSRTQIRTHMRMRAHTHTDIPVSSVYLYIYQIQSNSLHQEVSIPSLSSELAEYFFSD